MPTETYHEQAKGISKIWYVYRERLPKRPGMRIDQAVYEMAKEKIRLYGLMINRDEISSQKTGIYGENIYSVYGTEILIRELLLKRLDCCCSIHAVPQKDLTISAKDEEIIKTIAKKLNLPLETRVE